MKRIVGIASILMLTLSGIAIADATMGGLTIRLGKDFGVRVEDKDHEHGPEFEEHHDHDEGDLQIDSEVLEQLRRQVHDRELGDDSEHQLWNQNLRQFYDTPQERLHAFNWDGSGNQRLMVDRDSYLRFLIIAAIKADRMLYVEYSGYGRRIIVPQEYQVTRNGLEILHASHVFHTDGSYDRGHSTFHINRIRRLSILN
jgi:hypothetical protein